MSETLDEDLYRRTKALLEPGEIELDGVVVHTDLSGVEEPTLHQRTLDVGDVVAEHDGHDPADTYVYSGNDDPEFGVNQHQALTVDGDEFVWECQQLLRDGTYDVVFYYEKGPDNDAVVADIEAMGLEAVAVEG
jgi:hypothetical protein